MFLTLSALRFYFCRRPADMRKSFDGLSALVSAMPDHDPLDGAAYIFTNKRRNRIKLLVWDGDGFWIFYKRLEKGTFQVSYDLRSQSALQWSYDQLVMILSGIDVGSVKRRIRYKRPQTQ